VKDRKEDISLLLEWDLLQVFSIKIVLDSAHIYYFLPTSVLPSCFYFLFVLSNFGLCNLECFSAFQIM
jgi:hypothetical protein